MKRILILITALSLGTLLNAQIDLDTNVAPEPKMKIDLGIEIGISHFNKEANPYDFARGFVLRIPLMAHINLSRHWQLNTGFRYDFEWNSLYHNVERAADGGLTFLSTPTIDRQKAFTHYGYVGIPVQLVWYPWPDNHRLMSIGLDLFAACAISNYIMIENHSRQYTATGVTGSRSTDILSLDGSLFQPWKLEVGLTVSTDLLGLIHGVRVFTNLLPTYHDSVTGKKIYSTGITLFL